MKENDMNVTATEIEDSNGKLKKADHVINLKQYPPAAAKNHLEIEEIEDYNSRRGGQNTWCELKVSLKAYVVQKSMNLKYTNFLKRNNSFC